MSKKLYFLNIWFKIPKDPNLFLCSFPPLFFFFFTFCIYIFFISDSITAFVFPEANLYEENYLSKTRTRFYFSTKYLHKNYKLHVGYVWSVYLLFTHRIFLYFK